MSGSTTVSWMRLTTPEALSQSVNRSDGLKQTLGSLASIPYNRENPDRSVWWLFPAGRRPEDVWPANHLAKFIFDRQDGKVRAGVQFEKGYGAAAAKAAGSGARDVLHESWAWFTALRDLASGAFGITLREIADRADVPVHVDVEVSHKLKHGQLRNPATEYRFVYIPHDGTIDLIDLRKGELVLRGLEAVRSLDALHKSLASATNDQPFTWVELLVRCGIQAPGLAEPLPGPEWESEDFWERVLAPMARWVKR